MRYRERLRELQAVLQRASVPPLLVTASSNISYLTGIHAEGAVLLVRPRSAVLFVDARYKDVARSGTSHVYTVEDREHVLRKIARLSRCAFEEEHVTAARLRRWKSVCKSTKFVHVSGLVEGLRRKKDVLEIQNIRHALSITNDVLKMVPSFLVPGVTERALAARLHCACLERGADGLAFNSIVAFGVSTSEPHHVPGDQKLRKRDIVQIDMGARYKGYCSDRSEVFFVGSPTRMQRKAYEAVREAKASAAARVHAGVRCAEIDRTARDVLKSYGLEQFFTHALGHGVGIDIHEGVTVSSRSSDALISGDVLTIEPGVYISGSFGVRLEDTLFVA